MKRWSIIRCRMSTLLLATIYNGQQNIYKKYSSIWYLYTKAEILIWLIEASRFPVQNSYVCKLWYTEILSHFDIKSWVTCGTKIRPRKVGNWRIFESNWLNIERQIDSTLRVKLTQHWKPNWLNIESQVGSTLRVKLAQHWESSWLNIESQVGSTLRVKLAQHWESSWLNIESQVGPTLRVNLTQHWESNWLNIESQIDSNILQLLIFPNRIIIPPVTQIFSSNTFSPIEL